MLVRLAALAVAAGDWNAGAQTPWGRSGTVGCAATSALVSLVGFWVLGPGVGPPKPGLASVQSPGWGLGLKPSSVAWGMTMLIRFSTLVSSFALVAA